MQVFTPEQRRDRTRRLSDFALYVHPFNQMSMKDHDHDFIELVYVRGGEGIHCHNGCRYAVCAGDCFIIEPGEPHGYRSGRGLSIVNILFLPALLEPSLSFLAPVRGFRDFFSVEPLFRTETAFRYKLHLTPPQCSAIEPLIQMLYTEQEAGAKGYRAVCSGLFTQLLALLSRYYSANVSSQQQICDLGAKEQVVANAVSYLRNNYAEKVSVAGIASTVYLSASHLSHVFKETTGMSLFDYLLTIRMQQARELFVRGGKSITQVSFEVGFHDPGYFARTFRKFFGVSPSQFRREARG